MKAAFIQIMNASWALSDCKRTFTGFQIGSLTRASCDGRNSPEKYVGDQQLVQPPDVGGRRGFFGFDGRDRLPQLVDRGCDVDLGDALILLEFLVGA